MNNNDPFAPGRRTVVPHWLIEPEPETIAEHLRRLRDAERKAREWEAAQKARKHTGGTTDG